MTDIPRAPLSIAYLKQCSPSQLKLAGRWAFASSNLLKVLLYSGKYKLGTYLPRHLYRRVPFNVNTKSTALCTGNGNSHHLALDPSR